MKHIVFYSGGLGSWATARRVIEKEGIENVILLFTDTLIEDEDLYRFLLETSQQFYGIDKSDLIEKVYGMPLIRHETMGDRKKFLTELAKEVRDRNPNFVWINDGRDPWDVFFDSKYLGNSRIAQCSHILKQELSKRYIEENFKPHKPSGIKKMDKARKNIVYCETDEEFEKNRIDWDQDDREPCKLYLGIDWTEEHRTKAPTRNWLPYTVEFPMCEEPLVTKIDMAKDLVESGIRRPKLYDMDFSHNNCFSGDTKFITDEGIFRLDEKVGQRVKVMGKRGNWKDAVVKSFGRQEIYELKLKRYNQEKIIMTTKDHRWFVRKGRDDEEEKYTYELKGGDKLTSIYLSNRGSFNLINLGVMHGFTYGDGSAPSNGNPAQVVLCGDKIEMKKWFEPEKFREVKNVGEITERLPRYFKELPSLRESKAFLYSWLAGYFAADGSVTNGEITISSSDKSDLEFVKNVCAILGIGTNSIRVESRFGFNNYKTNLYTMTLVGYTLTEDFFLRTKHREEFNKTSKKRPAEWVVVDVIATGRIEEVYCAYVPDGHQFTLEDNIKTGNCGGFCVRAGQGHFVNLLKHKPQLYRYHEQREQEIREFLGKDVSILRRQKDGKKYRLTLKQLREEIESNNTKDIDMMDIGGCGCFVSYDD